MQTFAWLSEFAEGKIEQASCWSKVYFSFDDRSAEEKWGGRLPATPWTSKWCDETFIQKIITGDLCWIYSYDFEIKVRSLQRVDRGFLRLKTTHGSFNIGVCIWDECNKKKFFYFMNRPRTFLWNFFIFKGVNVKILNNEFINLTAFETIL